MLSIAKQGLGFLAAVVVLSLAQSTASFFAFPIGGHEFHAIFAYTIDGRLAPALLAYTVYLTSLVVTASFLIWCRYPVAWWLVACAATGLGLRSWWAICMWPFQSASFHLTVLALLPGFPIAIFGVCRLVQNVRQHMLHRRQSSTASWT